MWSAEMKLAVMLAVSAAVSLAAGEVKQCYACKTSRAPALFANLVCDRIPAMASNCTNFNKSSQSFLQYCPRNNNCLSITKGSEALRMCTRKQMVGTMRTTKGIVMAVCDRELCNAAGQLAIGAGSVQLLLLPLLLPLLAGLPDAQ